MTLNEIMEIYETHKANDDICRLVGYVLQLRLRTLEYLECGDDFLFEENETTRLDALSELLKD